MEVSRHASRRLQQRALRLDDIMLAIERGVMHHRAGAIFFFLGRRRAPLAGRDLDGLTVVLSKNGHLLSAYRNPRALRRIKAKPRYARMAFGRGAVHRHLTADESSI